jgi:hypothetical protein
LHSAFGYRPPGQETWPGDVAGEVAGDVAALCVSDGYASVNVQGWFIGGQTSNVTMAAFNVWQSKRYFHEQCIDRSTGNP